MPRESYYLPSRKLVSQDDAAIIQRAKVPRSRFENRWNHLTTFNAGDLIPFLVDEILPGDHMTYDVTAYVRMATALFPIFSNQRIDTLFFFVPNRLVWANWVRFMGEQDDPTSTIAFQVPIVTGVINGYAVGSIYDHMGIPVAGQMTAGGSISPSALPFRAYNMIFNQWFRDENIVSTLVINSGDGPDAASSYNIKRRAKSHDYFTSALPWPQKFTPLQTLFTGTAPIIGIGVTPTPTIAPAIGFLDSTSAATVNYAFSVDPALAGETAVQTNAAGKPQIFADLAQATGVTINALRQAWLVQDLLERDARGGTRYVELIRSHFGVTNPDFRLQRPEYIGGGQTPLNITPIAQTTPDGGGGLGALGAAGTAAGQHRASYAATEHGYIIGIINVKTELAYQQGYHRHWSRSVRQDFYFPSLAGLGEQAILRKEIYSIGGGPSDEDVVFGYQERWQEYRTHQSEVTGLFRSTSAGNIDEWHLAQQFSPAPTLSTTFIQDVPPMSRVLAAGAAADQMEYLADILINRTAIRPIPMFGTPATLARF